MFQNDKQTQTIINLSNYSELNSSIIISTTSTDLGEKESHEMFDITLVNNQNLNINSNAAVDLASSVSNKIQLGGPQNILTSSNQAFDLSKNMFYIFVIVFLSISLLTITLILIFNVNLSIY